MSRGPASGDEPGLRSLQEVESSKGHGGHKPRAMESICDIFGWVLTSQKGEPRQNRPDQGTATAPNSRDPTMGHCLSFATPKLGHRGELRCDLMQVTRSSYSHRVADACHPSHRCFLATPCNPAHQGEPWIWFWVR